MSHRQNVRNAYFAESVDTILAAWKTVLTGASPMDKNVAEWMRELLIEAMIETETATFTREQHNV